MPKFAANLSFLYTERPFLERFAAAAASGFEAVEFHFPYAYEPEAVSRAARAAGLQVVLFNLPAGNWERGDRGIACHPARIDEFRTGLDQAVAYAEALRCPRLNCLAGVRPLDVPQEMARATLLSNLRYAAELAARRGLTMLIEPINRRDVPGYFLNRTDQALQLIDALGRSNVMILYDIYHAQVSEGDLARSLADNIARIGHIQIADNPGRNEPGTGEINYPFLFAHLDRLSYAGWIGCEYRPSGTSESSLAWLRALA